MFISCPAIAPVRDLALSVAIISAIYITCAQDTKKHAQKCKKHTQLYDLKADELRETAYQSTQTPLQAPAKAIFTEK